MKLKLLAVVVLGAIGAGADHVHDRCHRRERRHDDEVPDLHPHRDGRRRHRPDRRDRHHRAGRTDRHRLGTAPWSVDDTATPPASPATYPVDEVKVTVGATVAEGDVLATADTTDLKAALAKAKNDLKSAQVSMRAADDQLDDAGTTAAKRQAKIARYNAINALDDAKAAVKDLEAQNSRRPP